MLKSRCSLLDQKIRLLELARGPHVQQPEKCCDDPNVLKEANECPVLENPFVELQQIEQD